MAHRQLTLGRAGLRIDEVGADEHTVVNLIHVDRVQLEPPSDLEIDFAEILDLQKLEIAALVDVKSLDVGDEQVDLAGRLADRDVQRARPVAIDLEPLDIDGCEDRLRGDIDGVQLAELGNGDIDTIPNAIHDHL